MIRLKEDEKKTKIIPMKDLTLGQIGVIVEIVEGGEGLDKKIVQKIPDGRVMILGHNCYFSSDCELGVRILQPGEVLEIV